MNSAIFQNTKSIELGVKNAEFFRIFGREGGAKYIWLYPHLVYMSNRVTPEILYMLVY